MRHFMLVFVTWLLIAGSAVAGETFATVKSARMLRCGVSTGLPGFAERDAAGRWNGLDVDFCRAVAAAVLGDPQKVSFKPLPTLARFPALMTGEIDILARHTTWTLGREAAMGIVFVGPLLYSRQGVMVRASSGIRQFGDLNDKSICVVKGSTQDDSLYFWARRRGLHIERKQFDSDDLARQGYSEGACQGYASDAVLLEALRLRAPGGKDAQVILREDWAMDPLSPVVRRDDNAWLQVVKAVWASLLLAEEMGLTQASFAPGAPPSQAAAVYGIKSDALAKILGVPPGFAGRAVAAVGNYGEMFERNLGSGSPLHLDRGPNRLWSDGGLMLPPGF